MIVQQRILTSSWFHQSRHVAAETAHEGVSVEGTKAASLEPAFDTDWETDTKKWSIEFLNTYRPHSTSQTTSTYWFSLTIPLRKIIMKASKFNIENFRLRRAKNWYLQWNLDRNWSNFDQNDARRTWKKWIQKIVSSKRKTLDVSLVTETNWSENFELFLWVVSVFERVRSYSFAENWKNGSLRPQNSTKKVHSSLSPRASVGLAMRRYPWIPMHLPLGRQLLKVHKAHLRCVHIGQPVSWCAYRTVEIKDRYAYATIGTRIGALMACPHGWVR